MIDKKELQPGDLVFSTTTRRNLQPRAGIYVGDGKFIPFLAVASEVRVEDMRQSYWQRRFDGAFAGSRLRLAPRLARWTTSSTQVQAVCGPPWFFRAIPVVAKWALYV